MDFAKLDFASLNVGRPFPLRGKKIETKKVFRILIRRFEFGDLNLGSPSNLGNGKELYVDGLHA